MPPRPFPFQLGVGTDIVDVRRVRAILKASDEGLQQLDRYMRRFLTRREREEISSGPQIEHLATKKGINIVSKHLAGRWAAKEATIKAVSWRRLTFHDIVIKRPRYGGGMHAVILDKPDRSEVSLRQDISMLDQHEHNIARYDPNGFVDDARQCSDAAQDDTGLHQSSSAGAALPNTGPNQTSESQLHPLQDASAVQDVSFHDGQYDDLAGQIAQISISHDGDYATAVCLAAQEPMDGDVGGEAAARNHL